MLEKDFDWKHTDKNGCTHQWNECGRSVGVFLDNEETFTVHYMMYCNDLFVECKKCGDRFFAKINGDGSNGI